MAKPKVFEKPIGVRDYLPHIVRRLRLLQTQVLECMERWGYEEIMTPTMEYYDTVGAASTTNESKLFKLLDPKGKTLVLRSDMTAPIARVAGSLLKEEPLPLRLAYHANVFRAPEEEAGRDAEFFQTGVELIGDSSTDADAEVIALAIACLESGGMRSFKMALGHMGFIEGLFHDLLAGHETAQQTLKSCLLKRNYVEYGQVIQQLALSAEVKAALLTILRLRGGIDALDRASSLSDNPQARAAITELRAVHAALAAYGVTEHVFIDLTMIGDFSYYTGVMFEGYATEQAFPVCSGGRYDLLLRQFGRSAPATGFALKTNRMLEWLGKQTASGDNKDQPYRVLVLYDETHRTEAIAHARILRQKHGLMVETMLLHAGADSHVETIDEQTLRFNGKTYQDIITFIDLKGST